ncbi:MAG: ribosome silencing factor [Anaerotignum sp.]|nr:ribosome silencing factor [Anaerotignum sp.]
MNALEAAKVAQAAIEDKLGEDIKVLDLQGLSNIADCFVIASGKNANQLHAMANEVEQKLFKEGIKLHHSEGYSSGTWILLDFGNLLVHLFNREDRAFYGLDHVWGDAPTL